MKSADKLETGFFGGLFNFSEDKGIGTFNQSTDWYTGSFENNEEVNPEAKRLVSAFISGTSMFSNKNIDVQVKRVKKSENPQIANTMKINFNGIDDIEGFDKYSGEIANSIKAVESPEYGYIVDISTKGELDDNSKGRKALYANSISLLNENKRTDGGELTDEIKKQYQDIFKEDGTVDTQKNFEWHEKYLQKKSIVEELLPNASDETKEELIKSYVDEEGNEVSPTGTTQSVITSLGQDVYRFLPTELARFTPFVGKYIPTSDDFNKITIRQFDPESQEAKVLVSRYIEKSLNPSYTDMGIDIYSAVKGGNWFGRTLGAGGKILKLSDTTVKSATSFGQIVGSGFEGGGGEAIDRTFEMANDDNFTKTDVLAQAARAGLNFMPAYGSVKTQSYIQNALGRKLGMTTSTALASIGTNTLVGGAYGAMDFGLAKMMGEKVSVTDYIPSIVAGNIIVGATIAKNFPELRANEKFVKGIKESTTAVLDHSAKTGLSYSDAVDSLYPDGFKVDGIDFTENLRTVGRSWEKTGREAIAGDILGTQVGKDAIQGVSDALGNVHKSIIENKLDNTDELLKKVMLADELEALSKDTKSYTETQRQAMKDQALKYRQDADVSKEAIDNIVDGLVGDKTLNIISEASDKIDLENRKLLNNLENIEGDLFTKNVQNIQNTGNSVVDSLVKKLKNFVADSQASITQQENIKSNLSLKKYIKNQEKIIKKIYREQSFEIPKSAYKQIKELHKEFFGKGEKGTRKGTRKKYIELKDLQLKQESDNFLAQNEKSQRKYDIKKKINMDNIDILTDYNISKDKFIQSVIGVASDLGTLRKDITNAKSKGKIQAISDKGDKNIQKAEYEGKISAIRQKFKVDATTKKEIDTYNKDKKKNIIEVKKAMANYRINSLIDKARKAMQERNPLFKNDDIMSDKKIEDLSKRYAKGDITIQAINKEVNKAIINNILGSYSALEDANGISRSESIKSVSELANKAGNVSKLIPSEGNKQDITQIDLTPEEIAMNSDIYSINARESIKTLLLGARYRAVQELKTGNADGAIRLLNDSYFTAKTLSDSINNVEKLVADSYNGELQRLGKIISKTEFGLDDSDLSLTENIAAQVGGGQDLYDILDQSKITSQVIYETLGAGVQESTHLKAGATTRLFEINRAFSKAGKNLNDFRLYIIAKEGRAGNREIINTQTGEFVGYEGNIFYNNQTNKLEFVKLEVYEKPDGKKGMKKLSAKYSIPTNDDIIDGQMVQGNVNKHIADIESNNNLKRALSNWKSLTDITGKVVQYGKYYTDGSILDIFNWYIPELGKNVLKIDDTSISVGDYNKQAIPSGGHIYGRVKSRRFFEHTVDLDLKAIENSMHNDIDRAILNPKLNLLNKLLKGVDIIDENGKNKTVYLGGNNEKLRKAIISKIDSDFGRNNVPESSRVIGKYMSIIMKIETIFAMGLGQVTTAMKQKLSKISFINRYGTKHLGTGSEIAKILGRKIITFQEKVGDLSTLETLSGFLRIRTDNQQIPQGSLMEKWLDSSTGFSLSLSLIPQLDYSTSQALVSARAAVGIDTWAKSLGFDGKLTVNDYVNILEQGKFEINGKMENINLRDIFTAADSEVSSIVMTSLPGQSPALMKNLGLTSHLMFQKAPLVDFVSMFLTPIVKNAGKKGAERYKGLLLASSGSILAFAISSLLSSEITNGVSMIGNALVDEAKDNNSEGEISLTLSRFLRNNTVESLSRPHFKESSPTYELLKLIYGDKDAFGRAMNKTVKGMTENVPFLGSFLSTDGPTSELATVKIFKTVKSQIFDDEAKAEADLINLVRLVAKAPGVKEGTKQIADTMKKYANEYADSYTFDQFKQSEEAKALKARMAQEYLNLYRVNGEALKKGDISVLQEMMKIEGEKSPRKEGEKEKTYINRLNATVIRKMQDAGQLQGVPENVQNVVNDAYGSFSNATKKKIVENGNKLENEIDDKAYLIRYNALGLGKDGFKTFLKDRLSRGLITSEKYKSVMSSYDKYSTDVFSLLLDYEKDLADFNYGEDLVTE